MWQYVRNVCSKYRVYSYTVITDVSTFFVCRSVWYDTSITPGAAQLFETYRSIMLPRSGSECIPFCPSFWCGFCSAAWGWCCCEYSNLRHFIITKTEFPRWLRTSKIFFITWFLYTSVCRLCDSCSSCFKVNLLSFCQHWMKIDMKFSVAKAVTP